VSLLFPKSSQKVLQLNITQSSRPDKQKMRGMGVSGPKTLENGRAFLYDKT